MNTKPNSKLIKCGLCTIAFYLALSSPTLADKWYEGGTLGGQDNRAWQSASIENKLATAADSVAVFWMKELLVDRIQNDINSFNMDSLKPYATELATCIDEGSKTEVIVNYSDMAIMCVAIMGWLDS